MSRIKYNLDHIKYISMFESITNAKVKDCIDSEQLIFIVNENEIGKAIGKQGINAKKIQGLFRRQIKIVEFSSDVLQFIKNFIFPLQIKDITNENNIITIVGPDTKTKGMLIGRDRINLNNLQNVVKRHFDVSEIKVV